MNKSDFILFSGGAPGAEAEFGACAERHGIEEVNFTFDGHTEARRRGVRVLNHEELQAGDVSLEYVSRLMHRRYTDSPMIRKVLQSLWYQVNNGQEIYVVGVILEDGTVRGGTVGAPSSRSCATSRCSCSTRTRTPGSNGRVRTGRRRDGHARHHSPALHRHGHPRRPRQRQARDRGPLHEVVRIGDDADPNVGMGLFFRSRRPPLPRDFLRAFCLRDLRPPSGFHRIRRPPIGCLGSSKKAMTTRSTRVKATVAVPQMKTSPLCGASLHTRGSIHMARPTATNARPLETSRS